MIYRVERYIAANKLLAPGGKALVALSGGADSVALLIVLDKLGYRCEAVHCNFHLRGEESNRDEQFVKQLCERKGIGLTTLHFDTMAYSREKGISIEMAARELRYAAFEELRREKGAEAIAVAHHSDDSAETLLLNLLRGTGIRGLCGIRPKNGYIVRPLLCVGRADILEYLKWRGEEYVTDSTNLTADYTRNKIRLELIPLMAEINPSILEGLAATARRLTSAADVYENAIDEAIKRVKRENIIDTEALKREIAPQSVLHAILSPLGFSGAQVEDISENLGSGSGKQFHSASWSIIKDRGTLIIAPRNAVEFAPAVLPQEGRVETPTGVLGISQGIFDGSIPKERCMAMLDASRLCLPLTLRRAEKGDRFAPFGMRGTRLVSDYLTDRKKNILEKQQQMVVTDATGAIVWLVDERPAAPYCIDSKSERTIVLKWEAH